MKKTIVVALSLSSALCSINSVYANTDSIRRTAPRSLPSPRQRTHPSSVELESKTSESIRVTGHGAISNNGVTGRAPGGGLMAPQHGPKTKQAITRDYIATQAPTSNPVQLLSMLPGANTASSDPFGLQGSTISVRGMTSGQIGWLFEGMPLNDVGNSAFYANDVVLSEDLREVSLTPGSSNINTPTISASGGLVEMNMIDPSHHAGGMIDTAYGSYNTSREFIRLESGDIGHTGARSFVSFANVHGNDWRGPGKVKSKQVDAKLVKDWADGSQTRLALSYASQDTQEDRYPTLSQFKEYGNSQDYNYTKIRNTANYYKLHRNMFQSMAATLPNEIMVTRRFHISETPYLYYGYGNGGGASTLTAGSVYSGTQKTPLLDPNGNVMANGTTVMAYTPSIAKTVRIGNVFKGSLELGNHTITGGYWYEWSDKMQQTAASYIDPVSGEAANIWGQTYNYLTPNGYPYASRSQITFSQVHMWFIEDQIDLLQKKLHIEIGFKDAFVKRDGYNSLLGAPYRSTTSNNVPLPQVSATYKLGRHHEFYVVGATNFRLAPNTSMFNVYSGSTGKLATAATSQNPEYSIEEELGYRYHSDLFLADVAFFNYNFTNRQLSLNAYQNGALVSENVNAGGQTTRGVDIEVATRPILYHLRPFASFEYLHASIDNNLHVGNDFLPTKGKTQIMTPSIQAALGLNYDDSHFFASINLKYIGKQYATFMNDEHIPGYFTNNVTLGYRMKKLGFLKAPQFQLNLSNIADAKFRTGVYSFTNSAQTTRGVYGTAIAGSAPTYYLMPGTSAMFSFSTGF